MTWTCSLPSGNYVCNVQVEKLDRTTRADKTHREETIVVACGFKAPADEIGVALMQQHLKDEHGISVEVDKAISPVCPSCGMTTMTARGCGNPYCDGL